MGGLYLCHGFEGVVIKFLILRGELFIFIGGGVEMHRDLAVVFMCAFGAPVAEATYPYTQVTVTGTVFDIPVELTGSSFQLGQRAEVTYTVDNSVADSRPSDLTDGYFEHAILSTSVVFGSNEIVITSSTGDVYTKNGWSGFIDELVLIGTAAGAQLVQGDTNGLAPAHVQAQFTTAGGGPVHSDGLLEGLDKVQYHSNKFFNVSFFDGSGLVAVRMDMISATSVQVPSGGGVGVLLVTGAFSCRRRR